MEIQTWVLEIIIYAILELDAYTHTYAEGQSHAIHTLGITECAHALSHRGVVLLETYIGYRNTVL